MDVGGRIGIRRGVLWALLGFAGATPALAGNAPPQAIEDRVTLRQENFIDIDVLANDTDPDGDFLSITSVSPQSGDHHTLSIIEESIVRFEGCATEPVTFQYSVEDDHGATSTATVTVEAAVDGYCLGNIVPVCVADFAVTPPGIPVEVDVLANDSHATSVSRVGDAIHGTVAILPTNVIRFQPTLGYVGDAGFRYWAVGEGGQVESSAWATVHVTEDPPGNEEDDFRTERGKILVLSEQDFLADDGDPGAQLTGVYVDGSGQGTVEMIEPPSGRPWVLYTPPDNTEGLFEFVYQAFNGSGNAYEAVVKVLVLPPAGNLLAADDFVHTVPGGCLTLPFAGLLSNDDAGPGNDPLMNGETIHGGVAGDVVVDFPARTVEYDSDLGYSGKDFIRYEARFSNEGQGAETDWATVVIDIGSTAAHQAPVTFPDWREIDASTSSSIRIAVLDNDSSPTCDGLDLVSVPSSTAKANLSMVGDEILYQPHATSSGLDEFQYVVSSAGGEVSTGTVVVNIFHQDRPPWPRWHYSASCENTEECVVDGGESRHGYTPYEHWNFAGTSGPYSGDRCGYYWYIEGATALPPETNSCIHDDPDQRDSFHLDQYFSEPGLIEVELKLWDRGLPASKKLLVPFGATTDGWTVDVQCEQNDCTFKPVGTWIDGVVEAFWWYFDGQVEIGNPCQPFGCGSEYPINPDAETHDLSSVTHSYSGVAPGDAKEVQLVVFLFDRQQWVSEVSSFTIPVPPPLAPLGLATDNQNCAASGPLLLWGDVSNDEDGFRVYRSVNGGAWQQLEGGELEANETELQDHYDGPRTHELRYKVAAFNSGGESLSAIVSGFPAPADCDSPGSVPIAPSHLSAGPPAEGVHLSWRDNSSQEVGYRMYRSRDGGAFELLAVLGTNATHYYDAPLNPGSTYAYRVRAINMQGESAAANTQVVVPLGFFVDSFERGDTSSWERVVGSHRLFFDSFESSDTSGWERVVQNGRVFFDGFESGDGSGWERAVNMNGLFKDSFESGDTSGWERSVGVWNSQSAPLTRALELERQGLAQLAAAAELSPAVDAMRRRTDFLLRPSDLSVAGYEAGGVNLSWRDRSTTELGYRLYRKGKQEPWHEVAVLPANATSVWDGPLEVGKKYRYRVAAVGEHTAGNGGTRPVERKSLLLRVKVPEEIFLHSFETRDFRDWSRYEDPSGQLKLASRGSLFGYRGLVVNLAAGEGAFLETDAPSLEPQLSGRFFLDPQSAIPAASLGEGQALSVLIRALDESGSRSIFIVELVRSGSGFGVRGVAWDVAGGQYATRIVPVAKRPSRVEFSWSAGISGSLGRMELSVADQPAVTAEGWSEPSLGVGRLRFGALAVAGGSAGELYLDEIALSRGTDRIGNAGVAGHLDSQDFELSSVPNWRIHTGGQGEVELRPANLEAEQALAVGLEGSGDQAYLEHSLFQSQDHLLLSLIVDTESLVMDPGGEIQILSARPRGADASPLFDVVLRRQGSRTLAVVRSRHGETSREASVRLPNRATRVEVEWNSSLDRDDGSGSLQLRLRRKRSGKFLRGTLLEGLETGFDAVNVLRLGQGDPVEAGVSGVLYLDDFESWR